MMMIESCMQRDTKRKILGSWTCSTLDIRIIRDTAKWRMLEIYMIGACALVSSFYAMLQTYARLMLTTFFYTDIRKQGSIPPRLDRHQLALQP
jgi:hypothetical protein